MDGVMATCSFQHALQHVRIPPTNRAGGCLDTRDSK
jgi:hypothetical protein